ncbi:hypothetical protein A9Q84_10965 [Halobacteriovorax marinus]|uniref:Response regulatory domain-containing protein n=1 Tax=Halobacteriovorax marinus TaxID=97084 RepID=A0A1Y5FDA9_9BACT|nr:hypothetical protein A9Q84_10965 [Halobacteriovorax marinus]
MLTVKQSEQDYILIVDDNQEIRDILAHSLEHGGYNVVMAKDGIEATLKMKNQDFALIITDLNLPKKDGVKLTNEIISMDTTPVLLITGELENFEIRLKNLKNVMLLPKPFKPEIIPLLVSKLISEYKKSKNISA